MGDEQEEDSEDDEEDEHMDLDVDVDVDEDDDSLPGKADHDLSSASPVKGKPFVCPDCGKEFNAHYNLTRHMPVHTGARPFVCKVTNCSSNLPQYSNNNKPNK